MSQPANTVTVSDRLCNWTWKWCSGQKNSSMSAYLKYIHMWMKSVPDAKARDQKRGCQKVTIGGFLGRTSWKVFVKYKIQYNRTVRILRRGKSWDILHPNLAGASLGPLALHLAKTVCVQDSPKPYRQGRSQIQVRPIFVYRSPTRNKLLGLGKTMYLASLCSLESYDRPSLRTMIPN